MIRFFISFLNTEIVISVLLFIIILLHFLPRRIPAAVWSVLWLIIALRIIVPFSVYRSPAFISADIPASPLEIRLTEYSPFSYSDEPSSSPKSPQDQQILKVSGAGKDAFFSMSVSQRTTNVLTGIFWVWLSGVICVLSVFSVRNLRLSRKLKRSIVNTDGIYETDLVENAAVFGIFKPVICLNPSSDPDIRDILISHEKTHIRRRDPLKKCIAFLLLSLHWFNPLAWAGFRYFLLDMEMACDEAVLKRRDHNYMIHYAEVLLKENTRLPRYKEAGMGFSG
ncbi:MAG: hypothetical protein IIY77_02890 [Lachnospiraceae bacterium]|nr:hypothetical protein [Lachnospiraceae bacterium]